jgi:hypothetical protein
MEPAIFPLTKSDYNAGLQCEKRLFLQKLRKEEVLPTAPDVVTKWRWREGDRAGEVARQRYPGGALVDFRNLDATEAEAHTAALMAARSGAIFEGVIAAGEFHARVDVLAPDEDGWVLTEVKTGMAPKEGDGEPKDKYVQDAAFQAMVANLAGVDVNRVSLLLLSRDYRHSGHAHNPHLLFEEVDITALAKAEEANTRARAESLVEMLQRGQEPSIETNRHCKSPHKCPYYDHCHRDQPEHDLIFLPMIQAKRINELRGKGYRSIDQIPAEEKLNPGQQRVREAVISGQTWVGEGLRDELEAVQYPIHFIDFEAAASALPRYLGQRCHQPVPFQWSNHILHENGRLEHREYLHRLPSDPCEDFAQTLWDAVQGAGSIVYYTDYENQRLKNLRMDGVQVSEQLEAYVKAKGVDLYKIVKDQVYHPKFKGSYSIKTVLPALVPSLGYDDLAINEGQLAAVEFMRMIDAADPDEAEAIAFALLAYCERDTLAMAKVFEALQQLVGLAKPMAVQGVFELI